MSENARDTEKHDGKLGGIAEAEVKYGAAYPSEKGIYITEMDDAVYLNPQQALSLLAWLKQEEETLEQLAKEQCA